MRSDGEITKEEFLNKKEEIDKKISQLTAEYEKDDCPTESDEAGLELSKIEAALNELIDFSQPVLPREIYQKFVSKVTPYSKTHYRWYLNLDGTGTQTADVKVNGRKSNAAVAFCDEGEIPPVHFKEIIFFNILKQEIINKKSFFVATLHRLQSRDRGNKNPTRPRNQRFRAGTPEPCCLRNNPGKPLKIAELTVDEAYAREFIKTAPSVHHVKTSQWKDIRIDILI